MPNMSYVMFENTYKDLFDVYEKMTRSSFNVNSLSDTEKEYYYQLINLCKLITEES